MDILQDREGHSNIRLIILVFVVLTGIVAALLYFPPIPTKTEPGKTSGEITFLDGTGNPLGCVLQTSVDGEPQQSQKNVNFIRWTNVPNIGIYCNAMDTKGVSVNFRISGDSRGKVILENYGINMPEGVNISVPGNPLEYVEINASGVSFSEAEVSLQYTDAQLNGANESSLVIYRYDNATQAWSALATGIDTNNNIASATVNSLSIFALGTQIPEKIEVRDTRNMPVVGDIKTYDEAKNVRKHAKTSTLSAQDVPERGELEVDALASKNVAVKLKVKAINKGEIVLDDFGKNNPVSVPLPGRVVKYVEIGANNISFSSANITIRYSDSELNGGNENGLTIYHWNGASWEAVPTVIDTVNKTLHTTTTSLSQWGVATSVTIVANSTGNLGHKGQLTTNTSDTQVLTSEISTQTLLTSTELDSLSSLDGATSYVSSAGDWNNDEYVRLNMTLNGVLSVNYVIVKTQMRTTSSNDALRFGAFNYSTGRWINLNGTATTSTFTNLTYNISSTAEKSAYLSLSNNVLNFSLLAWGYGGSGDTVDVSYFEATVNYNQAVAELSGYVLNSTGSPLSGATVETNTSLSTTTNASGFYNFTSLSNGTYMINASLAGYANNSITVTISGADNTTANISLTPLPTYLLSGYVTNATSGAAISGANVTTNTSLNTTTNATGYYNFTLSNGTYLITASNASYSDNSTTQTINGASVTNANITLAGVSITSGQIFVATERFVILDDPRTGTPSTGFSNPARDTIISGDSWSGKSTLLTAYALFLDNNGFPLSGRVVNFTLTNPGSVDVVTNQSNTTDSNGLAKFNYQLNGINYYGRWNIKAQNGTVNASYGFIYNWWGCAYSVSGGGGCNYNHNSKSFDTGGTINSPFMNRRDPTAWRGGNHQYSIGLGNGNCYACHPSYDNTGISSTSWAGHNNSPADVHRNIQCSNSTCHGGTGNSTSQHTTDQLVANCYSANCHTRTDISNKSTKNGVVSSYSNSTSATYSKYHTPNSSVPCIICHGPMHNITKPNATFQRFTRNQATESEQCTTCHSSYSKHNASVNCTLCHSDDVHNIKVFAQNATYITLNKNSPNPARGNCTNCHQNATFYAALKAQPNATNQSGRNPPIVAVPLEHSNDPTAGAKWKQTYWTNSQQLTWCIYCHSNTTHSAVALGRPANWDGNNIVNSSLTGNTTWCSGCHWQGYANGSNTYGDMVNAFTGAGLLVPPEISGNATYGANTSIYEYTNHSLYTRYYPNLNDSACNRCHGYKYGFTTITQLVHNQSRVGGANCADCHDIGGIALLARVNVTAANDTNAIHKNLSKDAAHVLNLTVYYDNNKRCWACHGNGSEPSTPNAHPTSYKMPENCTDCHIQSATQNFNYTPNNTLLNVTQHYWNGTSIKTPLATSCYLCHNRSEMLISANDPDAGSGAVYGGANAGNNSTSHYGKKRADLRIGINTSCSYCHQNESTVFTVAMVNTRNSTISNHSQRFNASNPSCTSSQCHRTGWIHNVTLTKPALTLPNSTYCLSCHGRNSTGSINFTGANTSIKEKHNNTINCTECHLGSSRDIHPAKYLQPNASYNTSNSTAVNCINCHQNLTVYPSLSRTPPKIPNPMYHSDNASNGTRWNTTGYWTNSTVTSCTYCHNDTKHNATALGRPAYWKGDNVVNSSITSASNWCAGCHYRGYSSGGKSYSDMTSAFTTANLPVPPEITNGTYASYNFSRYYNHSLTNYTDAACKPCHGINLTSGKITAFVHNITWGSCTDCHYSFSAMNITTRPDRYVNSTMFNASPHGGVACSNCHTKGHKNIGARKACEDCHAYQQAPLTDRNRHNITGAPGSGVVTNTDCTSCHDATLYNNAINNYGYNKTRDCDYCHTYPDKTYS